MRYVKNEDIYDDVIRALTGRAADDRASLLYKKRLLDDMRYFSYFALKSVGDTVTTLRVVFVNAKGAAAGKPYELTGREMNDALEKPKVFNFPASERKAKYIVASISAPDGYELKRAYDDAIRFYDALKSARLFDFVLINRREIISLVRGITGK